MDRRDFLKQVLFWSAGLSTSIPLFKIVPQEAEARAATASSPLVVHAVRVHLKEPGIAFITTPWLHPPHGCC